MVIGAVSGVVDKADAGVQVVVAARIVVQAVVVINIFKAVFFIVIIVDGILDGRLSSLRIPGFVPSGNEQDVVQIAWVGHGELFVLQAFFQEVVELLDGLDWHTAVQHVRIIIVVNSLIVKICYATCCAAYGTGRNLVLVANDDKESRCGLVIFRLNERLDG